MAWFWACSWHPILGTLFFTRWAWQQSCVRPRRLPQSPRLCELFSGAALAAVSSFFFGGGRVRSDLCWGPVRASSLIPRPHLTRFQVGHAAAHQSIALGYCLSVARERVHPRELCVGFSCDRYCQMVPASSLRVVFWDRSQEVRTESISVLRDAVASMRVGGTPCVGKHEICVAHVPARSSVAGVLVEPIRYHLEEGFQFTSRCPELGIAGNGCWENVVRCSP